MVASRKARKRFVKEVVALMRRYEFDGVDFNWEYPGYRFGTGYLSDAEVEKDYKGLMLVLEETRAALGPDAPITMSYYPVSHTVAMQLLGVALMTACRKCTLACWSLLPRFRFHAKRVVSPIA